MTLALFRRSERRSDPALQRKVHDLYVIVDDIIDALFPMTPSAETDAERAEFAEGLGVVRDGVWTPTRWLCRDGGPFTPDQAHRVMQQHLTCDADSCRARASARALLRSTGRMTADSSRPNFR